MSKYNKKKTPTKTVNIEGAPAYNHDKKFQLISALITNFQNDSFYGSASELEKRINSLIKEVGVEFAMKAAIFCREACHMRSSSHLVAGTIAQVGKGAPRVRNFFSRVVQRPDDMVEILSYWKSRYGTNSNRFPNIAVKGMKDAFNKFDGYQLAKYKMSDKTIKLVDLVNIVKPVPTERNSEALSLLVQNKLKQTGTWEDMLSSGMPAKEVWRILISENRLGYFALLRNLRNIERDADAETIKKAVEKLTNPDAIYKSRVLPFRFLTAYNNVFTPVMRKAVSQACDIAVDNLPELENTLVAIDTSGSMDCRLSSKSSARRVDIAMLFGSALARKGCCDLVQYGTHCVPINYDPNNSVMGTALSIRTGAAGHGTNMPSVFSNAKKKYDRIIFFTDEQSWMGNVPKSYESYKERTGANPFVYIFDLAGYGTTQLKGSKVLNCAGFSESVLNVMNKLEISKKALIDEVESIVL